MITFLNKPLQINISDEKLEGKPAYSDLIKVCLNDRPQQGFSIEEMRKRIKVLDVIEDAIEKAEVDRSEVSFEFEDDQAALIHQCVKQMKWFQLNKEIVEFVDHVTEQLK